MSNSQAPSHASGKASEPSRDPEIADREPGPLDARAAASPVPPEISGQVTRLLIDWRGGDERALDQLVPLVYDELRQVARRHMRSEGPITLQATALVNEAYLRLVNMDVEWQDRVHFFAVAASLMRRILVDEARRRNALKRGGAEPPLALEEIDLANEPDAELVALDDALEALSRIDERKARVIELRFFAGLTIAETSEVLEVGHATVERDLKMAKAWLAREMSHRSKADAGTD